MCMPADGNIADALTGNIMNSLYCEYNYLSARDYKHIYRMIPCQKQAWYHLPEMRLFCFCPWCWKGMIVLVGRGRVVPKDNKTAAVNPILGGFTIPSIAADHRDGELVFGAVSICVFVSLLLNSVITFWKNNNDRSKWLKMRKNYVQFWILCKDMQYSPARCIYMDKINTKNLAVFREDQHSLKTYAINYNAIHGRHMEMFLPAGVN